jgi:hypothetical protein
MAVVISKHAELSTGKSIKKFIIGTKKDAVMSTEAEISFFQLTVDNCRRFRAVEDMSKGQEFF